MKKFSCILLVLLLVIGMLPMYACAEEHTLPCLHSGVQLGMSKDEVLDLESKNGFEFEEEISDEHQWASNNKECSILEAKDEKLAGVKGVEGLLIDGGFVKYEFDEDEKLATIIYYFGNKPTANFAPVMESLYEQYGDPIGDNGKYVSIGNDCDITDMFQHDSQRYYKLGKKTEIQNCFQWLVEVDGGYVDITAMNWYIKGIESLTFCGVSYTFHTTDEIQEFINETNKDNDRMDSDL